jgi:hypothetical protein
VVDKGPRKRAGRKKQPHQGASALGGGPVSQAQKGPRAVSPQAWPVRAEGATQGGGTGLEGVRRSRSRSWFAFVTSDDQSRLSERPGSIRRGSSGGFLSSGPEPDSWRRFVSSPRKERLRMPSALQLEVRSVRASRSTRSPVTWRRLARA